ncbi:MAG: hypothetical protein FH758_06195 [Firmicutes bacterium]|nr:hypothetical protein [Bacillota bacterium]
MNFSNFNAKKKNITINLDALLILGFFLGSLSEGILSKLFQALILMFMFLRRNKNHTIAEERTKKTILILFSFPIVIFFIQIIVLELDFGEIRYLFGINKNLYIGLIIFLIARNYFKKIDNYMIALSLFLIYLNLGSLITILTNFASIDARVSFLSFASMNYATALSTISIPIYFYYFTNFKEANRIGLNTLNNISIGLCMMTILLSGSRANILFLVIEFLVIFFLIRKTIMFFLKAASLALFSYLFVTYVLFSINNEIFDLLNRGLSVFESTEDSARDLLWATSILQFEVSNKLIGSGSIIVQFYQKEAHNFIWEILLCSGILGLVFYVGYVTGFVSTILKKTRNVDKMYILLTLVVTYGIGYVQPFITTGYTFNILLWSSILVMSFSGRMKKLDGK